MENQRLAGKVKSDSGAFFQVKAMYRYQVIVDEACQINGLANALHLDQHPGDRRSRVPWARRRSARNALAPLRNFRYSHGQDEKLPPHRFLLHR
jgi:hypothetical protein